MKRKKLGYLSSGILGLASLTLLGVSNANHTHAATNGTINYKGGATTVWSSPEVGQTVKHYLNTGDKVSIQSSKKVFSETWYNLGNDEWVSSKYIDSNQVVAQPAAEVKADTVTANYKSGATTVWSDPESMAPTGEYLVYGATKKVLANKKVNNTTWYQIEGRGWVPETYVVLNNPSLTNVTPITVAPAVSKAEPAQQQPAEQPAASQQPAQQQPAEQPAASQQPAQQQPAEQAAAPQQPAQQSAEQPAAAQQSAQQQPAAQAAQQQPAQQQPAAQAAQQPAAGNHANYTNQGNSYPWGQCTYYAKSVAPWVGNYWGNGAQWASSARSAGFRVDNTPQAGAVISFAGGQSVGTWTADPYYGHVAVVQSYNPANNTVTITQGGMGFSSPTGPNTQVLSGATQYTYIHP